MTTTAGSVRAGTGRRVVVGLLAAYLALVARVTLWPQPASADMLDVVRETTTWLTAHHVPITYDVVEATSNVVMLVPFGVLVGLLLGRRLLVVVLGCALSVAIETSQALFLPTRVADPRDIVMNTLGAAVGVLLLRWWQRRVSTPRRPRGRPSPSAPG